MKRRAVVPFSIHPIFEANSLLEERAIERYRDYCSDAGPFVKDVW